LSNVIKAYAVRYDERTKKFIDTHLKDLAIEKTVKQEIKPASDNLQDGFVEGLNVATVKADEEAKVSLLAASALEEAKKEAENIIRQAKEEAAKIKNEAFAQAQKRGYDEGMQKARKEAERLEAEYAKKLQKLEEERANILDDLQPMLAELIAAFVEKITGIVIEDKKEVILYLVEKAVKKLDKCNELRIRVSTEDYEYVLGRREELARLFEREIAIYIAEDPSLLKNQCLIETDSRIIDCSLDVQLSNLITDIKLIGGIL